MEETYGGHIIVAILHLHGSVQLKKTTVLCSPLGSHPWLIFIYVTVIVDYLSSQQFLLPTIV